MAIDYIEIYDANCNLLGIVDTAESIIWRSVYFGVGDFEIYVQATPQNIELLQIGNLVTRPQDNEACIIESINIEYDPQSGRMITAAGRGAKSILDRRLIYNLSGSVNTPTILRGNVERAVRKLVEENAIACPFDSRRNIPQLQLGDWWDDPQIIIDENGQPAKKQVSFQNLLTYTDTLLQEYGLASYIAIDVESGELLFVVYGAFDRSWDNPDGYDPVIFGKDYDNLTGSSYAYDVTQEKNVALIGGAGEDVDRFYSLLAGTQAGLDRRELWVDASSINRAYKDENDAEKTYSDAEYGAMLNAAGSQQLVAAKAVETLDCPIDVQHSRFLYNRDFSIGDIVTVQDEELGKFINVRIREVLEVQDSKGYSVEIKT